MFVGQQQKCRNQAGGKLSNVKHSNMLTLRIDSIGCRLSFLITTIPQQAKVMKSISDIALDLAGQWGLKSTNDD